MGNTRVVCLVCGKELLAEEDALNCVCDGVHCDSHGNYGSKVYDALVDHKKASFAICDFCWEKADERGVLRWEDIERDPDPMTRHNWRDRKRVLEEKDAEIARLKAAVQDIGTKFLLASDCVNDNCFAKRYILRIVEAEHPIPDLDARKEAAYPEKDAEIARLKGLLEQIPYQIMLAGDCDRSSCHARQWVLALAQDGLGLAPSDVLYPEDVLKQLRALPDKTPDDKEEVF